MLQTPVLVLNRNYQPVSLTTARRAFCLLSKGHARAVGPDYRTYDLEEWMEYEAVDGDEAVDTPRQHLAVPRVLLLQAYDRLPSREVKFSRRNVYIRDGYVCQICGKPGTRDTLNLDHVVPVSKGGRSCWENVITACIRCNHFKGDRTPAQAGLKLLRAPQRPRWQHFMVLLVASGFHPRWKAFLPQLEARA